MMHFPQSQWNMTSQTLVVSNVVWIPSRLLETNRGGGGGGHFEKDFVKLKGTL